MRAPIFDSYINFNDGLNNDDDLKINEACIDFVTSFNRFWEYENVVTHIAILALLQEYDAIDHNYFIYYDEEISQKWKFFTWDRYISSNFYFQLF